MAIQDAFNKAMAHVLGIEIPSQFTTPQLFKAPPLVNPIDPDTLGAAQDCMDGIVDFFYRQGDPLPDIFRSVMEVNYAVGNSLTPPDHLVPIVDRLAVVAKQLPIIISEMHEMVSGGIKCLVDSDDASVEEFINGVADTHYTVLGLAARLGNNNYKTSYFGDILRLALGPHYTEIMNGVCGEQASKFILENEILQAIELFKSKGIDVTIIPDGSGMFVIKSAKDQVVNGEHYPKGKWLKGPNFERYKLPESIINEFKNCEDLYSNIIAILYALRKQDTVEVLLHQVNKLNDYVVHLFGEEWKMNLTKRDEFLAMLADQVSSPKTIGDPAREHTTTNL